MSDRTRRITVTILIVLGVLVCCSILLRTQPDHTLIRIASQHGPIQTGTIILPDGGTVSVNTSDPTDLTVLPGIGETTAAAWVTEYENNGPFYYPEDLLSIRGIGQKKLKDIIEQIDLSAE